MRLERARTVMTLAALGDKWANNPQRLEDASKTVKAFTRHVVHCGSIAIENLKRIERDMKRRRARQ